LTENGLKRPTFKLIHSGFIFPFICWFAVAILIIFNNYLPRLVSYNSQRMISYTQLLNIDVVIPIWSWPLLTVLFIASLFILYKVIKLREKKILEIQETKLELEKLRAENFKNKFEIEQINNFFSTSLLVKNDVEEVLWDVCKNLIAKLGFEDCLIYMWNKEKTRMVQHAGFGIKDSKEILVAFPYDPAPGEGIVGTVAQTGEAIIVNDTSKDDRYIPEGYSGQSEICVPIKYGDELLGVIDSEHSEIGFFNERHLNMIATIGTLMATKIKSLEAEQQFRKQKTELDNVSKKLAEMQLAALRSQMNPHFIFNALNSIKKFVLKNEAESADKYLGKFSRLIRSILDTSREEKISLQKELEMLTLYLELEKLRFGTKLDYTIEVDPLLMEQNLLIPTMVIQPFIENAILHGIMHKESEGKVLISFSDRQTYIEIKITDNGIGRKLSAELQQNKLNRHASLGIEVTAARLFALKNAPEIPSGIEITDLEENGAAAGTLVKVFVPK
jgi:two-component system LytT family sensor kinase